MFGVAVCARVCVQQGRKSPSSATKLMAKTSYLYRMEVSWPNTTGGAPTITEISQTILMLTTSFQHL